MSNPYQQIIEHANELNKVSPPLEADELEIRDMVVIGNAKNSWNTRIQIHCTGPAEEVPYAGLAILRYHRIDLGHYFKGISPAIELDGAEKISELLPIIRERYELDLYPDDIVDGPITPSIHPYTVTVATQERSVGFTGSMSVEYSSGPPKLSTVIPNVDLDVLTIPTGQLAAFRYGPDTWRAWNQDFTAIQDTFLALANGYRLNSTTDANWNKLLLAFRTTKFVPVTTPWYTFVNHYDVNDPAVVAYSNKNFTHVTVLSPMAINASVSNATLYLHYNKV